MHGRDCVDIVSVIPFYRGRLALVSGFEVGGCSDGSKHGYLRVSQAASKQPIAKDAELIDDALRIRHELTEALAQGVEYPTELWRTAQTILASLVPAEQRIIDARAVVGYLGAFAAQQKAVAPEPEQQVVLRPSLGDEARVATLEVSVKAAQTALGINSHISAPVQSLQSA